ncbi:MAG: hypothetical protein E6I80_01025 [Chloroflexi bacterium]|nr:MAG: hypothetical protein E6I80_01025 [Chloroflexota bacterium]
MEALKPCALTAHSQGKMRRKNYSEKTKRIEKEKAHHRQSTNNSTSSGTRSFKETTLRRLLSANAC